MITTLIIWRTIHTIMAGSQFGGLIPRIFPFSVGEKNEVPRTYSDPNPHACCPARSCNAL